MSCWHGSGWTLEPATRRYHGATATENLTAQMRLAIFGARGVPAKWGGFDTFVTELAPRLARKGHDVTLFTMPKYTGTDIGRSFEGVRIIRLPTIYGKFTETVVHEALSSLYALVRPKQDIYYVLGCRTVWAYLPHWLLRRTLVINTDGLDWQRRKWGRFARFYLKANYWLARKITSHLVMDSYELKKFYLEQWGTDSAFLTNGGHVLAVEDLERHREILAGYGIEQGSYYLVACRLEPENNIDIIIREFERSSTDAKLLIAGGANYKSAYIERLQATTDERIVFLGPVYEAGHIEALHLGARGYLHGHEVGGTNPSLLKAMGCGNVILAHDVRFNREVLGGTGMLWTKDEGSMLAQLEAFEADRDAIAETAASTTRARIIEFYSWDKVADDHERYFRFVLGEVPDYADSF
jgi:glycosyltransferase involved in cell wall biosynthesis